MDEHRSACGKWSYIVGGGRELSSRPCDCGAEDTAFLDWMESKGFVLVQPDFTPDTSGVLHWEAESEQPLRDAIRDAMALYPSDGGRE